MTCCVSVVRLCLAVGVCVSSLPDCVHFSFVSVDISEVRQALHDIAQRLYMVICDLVHASLMSQAHELVFPSAPCPDIPVFIRWSAHALLSSLPRYCLVSSRAIGELLPRDPGEDQCDAHLCRGAPGAD